MDFPISRWCAVPSSRIRFAQPFSAAGPAMWVSGAPFLSGGSGSVFWEFGPKKCWKRTFAGSVVDEKPNYFCGIPTSWSMSGCRRKWTWIFTNFKGQSMTKLQHYRPSLLPGMGWASLVHIQAAKTLQDSRVQAPTFQRCFEPRGFCLFLGYLPVFSHIDIDVELCGKHILCRKCILHILYVY